MMELAKHKAGVHRGISARGAVLSTESYTLNLKGEQSCSCEFSIDDIHLLLILSISPLCSAGYGWTT